MNTEVNSDNKIIALNTITEIISKRVEDRLDTEIQRLYTEIREHHDKLDDLQLKFPGKQGETSFRSATWSTTSPFFIHLRGKLREGYTKEETRRFVEEVAELKQKVKDLENGITHE